MRANAFTSKINFQPKSVDSFVTELKTLARTCNFWDSLQGSLTHDCVVLGFKSEQTIKKLLRMREDVTVLQMKVAV